MEFFVTCHCFGIQGSVSFVDIFRYLLLVFVFVNSRCLFLEA